MGIALRILRPSSIWGPTIGAYFLLVHQNKNRMKQTDVGRMPTYLTGWTAWVLVRVNRGRCVLTEAED